jgi:hypothetical protein
MNTDQICEEIQRFIDDPNSLHLVGDPNDSSKVYFNMRFEINYKPCFKSKDFICFEIENRDQLKEVLTRAIQPEIQEDVMIKADKALLDENINPNYKFYLRFLWNRQ